MTLEQIATRVKRKLTGGDYAKDNPWDVREIADTIRDVTHSLMKLRFYELRNEGGIQIPSHYIATFEPVEVKIKTRKGKSYCYVDLPANYLELPMEMGVQSVIPLVEEEEEQKSMIPLTRYFKDVYNGLATSYLEHQWGYEVRRKQLIFTEKDGETLDEAGIDELAIDLAVVSPLDSGLEEEYPIPPEMVDSVIYMTLERYGVLDPIVQRAKIEDTPNLQD